VAGNITKRGDKTWRVTVYLGEDPDTGKPIQHRKTIHGTKKEAQTYLTGVLREKDMGRFVEPSKLTLGTYLEHWLQSTAKLRLRRSTFESYEWTLARYVRPVLGPIRMDRITPMNLQGLYADMLEQGLSARTVRYAQAILHSALKQAVRWKLIPGNPADDVDLPKQRKTERPIVPPEKAEAFFHAALEDRWAPCSCWPCTVAFALASTRVAVA